MNPRLVARAHPSRSRRFGVVLMSVTEGEDKPLKYPTIFNSADLAVITKIDLIQAVDFDRAAAHRAILQARPDIEICELSAKTGDGFGDWASRLAERAAIPL